MPMTGMQVFQIDRFDCLDCLFEGGLTGSPVVDESKDEGEAELEEHVDYCLSASFLFFPPSDSVSEHTLISDGIYWSVQQGDDVRPDHSLTGKELSLEPTRLDVVLSSGSTPWSQLDFPSRFGHVITALIARQRGLHITHDERSERYIDVSGD